MRKTITIVAALLAAFFLTSCDQILEGFYPEFASGGSGKNGVVSIRVNVSTGSQGIMDFENGVAPISIAFVPFTESQEGFYPDESGIQVKSVYKNEFEYLNNQYTYLSTFEVSRNMITRVIVWCDLDNDGEPTNEGISEPGIIVTTEDFRDYLDLRWHKPSDKEIVMSSAPLNSNSMINWNQFSSDPTGDTGVDDGNNSPNTPSMATSSNYINSEGIAYVWASSESDPDPSDWIVDHEWTIEYNDGSGTEFVNTGYSSYLERQFYNFTAYPKEVYISLRIQDSKGAWSEYSNVITIYVGGTYTENQLPTASLSLSPSYPSTTDKVYFYDYSYDYGGYITNWYWEVQGPYGLETSSTSQNFDYTFDTAGSYTVYLSVTDNEYGTAVTESSFTVSSGVGTGDNLSDPYNSYSTYYYEDVAPSVYSDRYIRMNSTYGYIPYVLVSGGAGDSNLDVTLYDGDGNELGSGAVNGWNGSYIYADYVNNTATLIVRVRNNNAYADYYTLYSYAYYPY